MSAQAGDQKRSPKTQGLWTQADRDFIRAARDNLVCDFYFLIESFLETTPDMTGKVIVVDRYFLQVDVVTPKMNGPMWIAKNALLATHVPRTK